ncbi:hypothetical protein F1188_14930 [Roseospira marina]|uniref:MarR family transcriptional regulator n=1 Tax=Roseospira marina TaxID=140057 RepID=A0A5M6I8W7_9PROT|nr:hypothetical protein [Roseospira marina]KAA5604704.1 hypothetical protein F1188_14930 [Roseospira marina]MBB4315152.1 putative transcriptional regulator [Roseospira marina]MBB5088078.1 putative transcriptional regulator [Roseospira marina]
MSGSDTVTVQVGTLEDMGRRFVDAWHRAERGEEVDERHVTFIDLPALRAALTARRLALLRYVRHHEVRTVQALAAGLHRNEESVQADVDALTKLGLLTRTADHLVVPYGEINTMFVL